MKRVLGRAAALILVVTLLSSVTAFAQGNTISYHLAPKLNYTSISPTATRYSDLWVASGDGKTCLINSNGDILYDAASRSCFNFDDGVFIVNEDNTVWASRYEEDGSLTPDPDFGIGGSGMLYGTFYDLDTQKIASTNFDFTEDYKNVDTVNCSE